MKNKQLLGTTLVCFLVLWGLSVLIAGDKTHTIVSSDGGLELRISQAALPESMSIDEIIVEPILDPESGEVLGYELLPDGLQLVEPIEFEYSLIEANSQLPSLIHMSEAGSEFVEVAAVVPEGESLPKLTGNIQHFSQLLAFWPPFHVGFNSTDRTIFVGETFSANIVIRHTTGVSTVGSREHEHQDWTRENDVSARRQNMEGRASHCLS